MTPKQLLVRERFLAVSQKVPGGRWGQDAWCCKEGGGDSSRSEEVG
jgi:hypothetical protein